MVKKNIFFVGLMAVGKTTVGKLLAKSLAMSFYDSDLVIEDTAGTDIGWIFEKEGEKGFRDREAAVLKKLCKKNGIIISTGGGAVLRSDNRHLLSTHGIVIHLDCPIDVLVRRVGRDDRRPLLQDGNPFTILSDLKIKRDPLYEQIADYKFETLDQSPQVLSHNIARRLQSDGVI